MGDAAGREGAEPAGDGWGIFTFPVESPDSYGAAFLDEKLSGGWLVPLLPK